MQTESPEEEAPDSGATSTAADLSRDEVFDILSNVRRRYVLSYLSKEGGAAELQELSRRLAAWENDVSESELTKKQEKRVYVSLYQTHVPKLEESGVLVSGEDGEVRLTSGATAVTAYLDESDEQRRWPMYFFGLSVVGGLFLLVVGGDVGVFGAVPDLVADLLVVAAFLLLSGAYFVAREGPYRTPLDRF